MTNLKIQNFVFTAMMVFVMAFTLTLYNVAFGYGSFQPWMFRVAIVRMWLPYAFAFLCEMVIAKPLASKIVAAILPPDVNSIFKIILVALIMVSVMCPVMTLFISITFVGFTPELPALWLSLFLRNYPFVLCFQILIAGPLVRAVSGALFRTAAAMKK